MTDGTFVITDDECGVAQSLAEVLQRYGARVALIRMDDETGEVSQGVYRANLTDAAAVTEILKMVRLRQGSIAGVIHALPLKTGAAFEELDLTAWRHRINLDETVAALAQTAKDMNGKYKETSEGGRAHSVVLC